MNIEKVNKNMDGSDTENMVVTIASRGRPKEVPLQLAKRTAIKAVIKMKSAETLFIEASGQLAADVLGDKGLSAELKENANKRLEIAKKINSIRIKKNQTKKELDDLRADSPQSDILRSGINKMTEVNKNLRASLSEEPPLGMSNHEWGILSADDKYKDVGRPKLSLESKLASLMQETIKAVSNLNTIEKEEGEEISTIDSLSEVKPKITTGKVGRPELDVIGKLDKKLHITERRIRDLYVDNVKRKAAKNYAVKTSGRKPIAFEVKLQKLQKERVTLVSEIKSLESHLDSEGLIARELKLMKDERRNYRVERNKDPEKFALTDNATKLNDLEIKIKALETKIKATKIGIRAEAISHIPTPTPEELKLAKRRHELLQELQSLQAAG